MSKNIHWNPRIAEHEIMGNAMIRLKQAANIMAAQVEKAAPEGDESRPMYKTGPYRNKYWTARDAGALKGSVRVVTKNESTARNVRIIAGNRKVYYAKIVEFYTPFFRPAINRSKRLVKNILMGK